MDAARPLDPPVPERRRHPSEGLRLPGCEERREFPRLRRTLAIRFRSGGLLWNAGQALNLSVSGARVVVGVPLEEGQTVHVRFHMAPDWQPQLVCRVTWRQPLSSGSVWILGLQFVGWTSEDADHFHRWLRRQQQEELGPPLA